MAVHKAQKSSFFPDTEEEESLPKAMYVQAKALPPMERVRVLEAGSGGYVGDIEFPATRSILWDRRPLSQTQVIHVDDVAVPRFAISTKAIKTMHQHIHGNTLSLPQLVGHVSFHEVETADEWKIVVDSFTPTTSTMPKAKSTIEVYALSSEHPLEQDGTYEQLMKDLSQDLRGKYYNSRPIDFLKIRFIVSISSSGQIHLDIQTMAPSATLSMTPIRNLPLLMTPLSKLLLKEGTKLPSSWGFTTLDKARKMVPLIPNDPLCLSRPLVGIWVRTVSISSVCMASIVYGLNKEPQDKVWISPRTFLLVKYPSEPKQWLPEFFECTLSDIELGTYSKHLRNFDGNFVSASIIEFRLTRTMTPSLSAEIDSNSPISKKVGQVALAHESDCFGETNNTEVRQQDTSLVLGSSEIATPIPFFQTPLPIPQPIRINFTQSEPSSTVPGMMHFEEVITKDHNKLFQDQQKKINELENQIEKLSAQLNSFRAQKQEICSVGTNTSMVFTPQEAQNVDYQEISVSEHDLDDELSNVSFVSLPLTSNFDLKQVTAGESNSLCIGQTIDDIPRIRYQVSGESDLSEDDAELREIEARYKCILMKSK
ncbi:hypothetical protein AeRB84_015501 [Aphanomyces euteiches]|nr:hypothetical protein AeRB84_015501 [Aphanomyces euteiches]